MAYAVAFLLLLVLIQWPVGGYAPYDHLPSTSPDQNETMDADPPAAPVLASAVLAESSDENVLITWSLSADDGAGDDDVSHYAVYISDAYDYEGDGYSYLGQAGIGETSFTHTLAGDGDWLDHFYYVQANDTSGNGNWSGQAGKFVRFLEKGKHLASVPLVQEDTTLEVVLQTLAGSFKYVRYYKSSDQSDHWKTYWTFKTYGTLFDIDHRMGFWIDMTKDDHLVVAGLVPEMTQIELGHNWNLVGYPSFIDRTVSDALAGIDWQKVQGWGDTPPYHQKQMSASDIMTAGEGYWVWVDLPQVLEICNKPYDSPYIVSTYPADGEVDVPLDADIVIDFSEPIDIFTFSWDFIPDPGGWMYAWSNGNRTVTLLHANPYMACSFRTVIITNADDTDGNPLVPGPVPNPWSFTTECPCCTILFTDPMNGELDVPLDHPITIAFSDPMNPATFDYASSPDPGGWVVNWSNGDTMVVLDHNDFEPSTVYAFEIVYIEDINGIPLNIGPVPNPFMFETVPQPPYIVQTEPFDGETGVEVWRNITVWFSEPMNTSSVGFAMVPFISMNVTWFLNDTKAVLSHSIPFLECTEYAIHVIEALDKDGYPLIPGPVPNPWSFMTVSIGPYIVQTDPYDGQLGVPLNQSVIVWFSQPMSSMNLTIVPFIGFQLFWLNNTTLELYHTAPFDTCQEYEINISGLDLNGLPLVPGPVPNPFSFTTDCGNPYIVLTDPYDGEVNVEPDRNITIWFSEPMDTSTVIWAWAPPDPGGWMMNWSANETVLFLNHSNLLSQCTMYSVVVIYGEDKDGNPLVPGPVPNPWNFTTCGYPCVLWTDPVDGSVGIPLDVDIVIGFSWAMNQSSFNWTIDPDPGGWSVDWVDNATVVLSHSNPFDPLTTYVFTILYIEDIYGMPLFDLPFVLSFST